MFRLRNVATRRRDRITSDEEQRERRGYDIVAAVRFARRQSGRSARERTLHAAEAGGAPIDGGPALRLSYGDAATIWRINEGPRRRANRAQLGFVLDVERGYWARDADAAEGDADSAHQDPLSQRTVRVIPYVTDARNALLIEPVVQNTPDSPGPAELAPAELAPAELDVETMASVQAALTTALQVVFQLEPNEIAAEPLPSLDNRRQLLVYEAAEGGAGALKQLVDDPSLWHRIAREALRRCHANPDTGDDQDGPGDVEPCEAACYDCLMSYSNQGDHALLDRRLAIEYLAPLTRGAAFARDEHDADLAESAESGLEQQFLSFLERGGYRRPDRAQVYFETARTRPDFVYDEACAVVYVDGPHHDYPERAARDAIQEQAMNDLGYQVIRFGHADDWQSIAARHPAVFGLGGPWTFSPGSLVTARGRDWVVLPDSTDHLVMVRPLGGTDDEATGILASVEEIAPARFDLPDPAQHLGDAHSARLLRDALRLGFRSGAGPFRSVAQLAVDPRPYQLVPLLMALRLDPVRLLIADDVGVGKTIEAALVAAELMAQGDADRLAVLCPPHLAEQWKVELADKFHIDAELVLASTAARLERGLAVGQSIFDRYPNVIVSLDFIKSDRRRDDFIRACPELVIVDEAHTCARAGERAASGRHQRHALVSDLAAKPERHLILVTATPHSGKDESFRSLLSLLDGEFADLPHDLTGDHNRPHRERLARHLVQRRRADIDSYLETETHFPQRADREQRYHLSPDYRALFDEVLRYARSTVADHSVGRRGQRIRWWSALGLLRALASSPAAAAATLRTRAVTVDAEADSAEAVDELGRRLILDLDDAEEAPDVVPGSQTEAAESAVSRRLREFAAQADQIADGPKGTDAKLEGLIELVGELLADGFQPIVFCRFIETAEYVAERLRTRLPKRDRPEVAAVTGRLPPSDREARVAELAAHPRRVLVATDCLSEGINLQDHFSAVVHYDLPWNPTRLEQREGRVDRYGQPQPEVRVVTYWGADNRVDETVLEVLLRKHRRIRGALGVSIPVPGSTSDIIEALAEQVLASSGQAMDVPIQGIIEQLRPKTDALDAEWERARDNEVRRRSLFAQSRIDPSDVADELAAMREAIGSGADVERFMTSALGAYGAAITKDATSYDETYAVDLSEVPDAALDALGGTTSQRLMLGFGQSTPGGGLLLSRAHPAVGGLAGHVLDQALDSANPVDGIGNRIAARCGVMRTDAVSIITTLLLCRVRMSIAAAARSGEHHMLAEEAMLLAFAGAPQRPDWLAPEQVPALLEAEPAGNVLPEVAAQRIAAIIDAEPHWRLRVAAEAESRAGTLAEAHARVRAADRRQGVAVRGPGPGRVTVTAQTPTDVLAVYHFLPVVVS